MKEQKLEDFDAVLNTHFTSNVQTYMGINAKKNSTK